MVEIGVYIGIENQIVMEIEGPAHKHQHRVQQKERGAYQCGYREPDPDTFEKELLQAPSVVIAEGGITYSGSQRTEGGVPGASFVGSGFSNSVKRGEADAAPPRTSSRRRRSADLGCRAPLDHQKPAAARVDVVLSTSPVSNVVILEQHRSLPDPEARTSTVRAESPFSSSALGPRSRRAIGMWLRPLWGGSPTDC